MFYLLGGNFVGQYQKKGNFKNGYNVTNSCHFCFSAVTVKHTINTNKIIVTETQ